MKSTLIENINNFHFEKNDDNLKNPPLHKIQKPEIDIHSGMATFFRTIFW